MTEHPDCPDCQCWLHGGEPVGTTNKDAEFYPLIELVMTEDGYTHDPLLRR